MSAAKKKNASSPAWTDQGIFWLFGSGRFMLWLALLLGVFFGGWYYVWRYAASHVLTSPEFHIVSAEQLVLPPQPEWISHTDVRAEGFNDLNRNGPLRFLDETLAERIAKTFSQRPWVAKVKSVVIQRPSVKIDLEYRKPVCVVEIPTKALPQLIPVDVESTELPLNDFTPPELFSYPHVAGVEREPSGLVPGRRWWDARVIGAAEIAAVLLPAWKELKLQKIVPHTPANIGGSVSAAGSPAKTSSAASVAANNPSGVAGTNTLPQNSNATTPQPTTSPGSPPSPVPMTASTTSPMNSPTNMPSDVARPPAECTFSLVTTSGSTIYWGVSPMIASGEPSGAEKIARLRYYFANHSDTFDGTQGPQKLDVNTMRSPVQQ